MAHSPPTSSNSRLRDGSEGSAPTAGTDESRLLVPKSLHQPRYSSHGSATCKTIAREPHRHPRSFWGPTALRSQWIRTRSALIGPVLPRNEKVQLPFARTSAPQDPRDTHRGRDPGPDLEGSLRGPKKGRQRDKEKDKVPPGSPLRASTPTESCPDSTVELGRPAAEVHVVKLYLPGQGLVGLAHEFGADQGQMRNTVS
jgi:hypothetical protein